MKKLSKLIVNLILILSLIFIFHSIVYAKPESDQNEGEGQLFIKTVRWDFDNDGKFDWRFSPEEPWNEDYLTPKFTYNRIGYYNTLFEIETTDGRIFRASKTVVAKKPWYEIGIVRLAKGSNDPKIKYCLEKDNEIVGYLLEPEDGSIRLENYLNLPTAIKAKNDPKDTSYNDIPVYEVYMAQLLNSDKIDAGPNILTVSECPTVFSGTYNFENNITMIAWDFDSDGTIDTYSYPTDSRGELPKVEHIYEKPGEYIALLYVYTDQGQKYCDAVKVNVLPVSKVWGKLRQNPEDENGYVILTDKNELIGLIIEDEQLYNQLANEIGHIVYFKGLLLPNQEGQLVDDYLIVKAKYYLRVDVKKVEAGDDQTITLGDFATLRGEILNINSNILAQAWDFDDDGNIDQIIIGDEPKDVFVNYKSPGKYVAVYWVLDEEGNLYKDLVNINVRSKVALDGILMSYEDGIKGELFDPKGRFLAYVKYVGKDLRIFNNQYVYVRGTIEFENDEPCIIAEKILFLHPDVITLSGPFTATVGFEYDFGFEIN